MFSWFLNPWMLLGGLAIASPILIHLLNKRRFKIVEWAAMDFLFQADKKNRRRVELENFILLMLRCLAMLLLAFMLARPFLPSSLTRWTNQTEKFENVVLIDDSLSQRVLNNQAPAIDLVKSSLVDWMTQSSRSNRAENWLTVILTSRPDQPLLANEPLTPDTLAGLVQTVNAIQTTDTVADYSLALTELRRYVQRQRENVGRVVYFFSDLRQRDWIVSDGNDEKAPNRLLNETANTALNCFLVDVGGSADDNLSVVDIRPDGLLLNDKLMRFTVTLANHGSSTVENLRVIFQVDQSQPKYETLPTVAPGQTQEVTFLHLFPRSADRDEDQPEFSYHRIRAEIDRQSLGANQLAQDNLPEDSSALFAAKVSSGISVLLVDGDPASISERSETHYLRSLQVPGTGLRMQTVTVSEFETIPLSQYQVIFLCNVDEASRDRIENLAQWVKDGGGLVLMPGNRVRAAAFNSAFYDSGKGLSPVVLGQISGSATMSQWVNFDLAPQVHPALRVIVDSDAASLSNVDIFSWWNLEPDPTLGNSLAIPLRLTNDTNSPAMVERSWGKGKVVVFAIPSDGDWTMWPSSPTFAPVMIDLIDYLIGSEDSNSNLKIGNPIYLPVDLAVYDSRVGLRNPKDERIETVARPIKNKKNREPQADLTPAAQPEQNSKSTSDSTQTSADSPTDSPPSDDSAPSNDDDPQLEVAHAVQFDNVYQRGFYQAELKTHTGETETVLFAADYDPRESNLKRLKESQLEENFFNAKVQRITPKQLNQQSVSTHNSEIWPLLLVILFGVLVTEQGLAWWWGRKR